MLLPLALTVTLSASQGRWLRGGGKKALCLAVTLSAPQGCEPRGGGGERTVHLSLTLPWSLKPLDG